LASAVAPARWRDAEHGVAADSPSSLSLEALARLAAERPIARRL